MTTPTTPYSQMSNEQLLQRLASCVKSLSDVDLSSTERFSKYVPHKPFEKQKTFLDLDCLEAFYGGGAGPGKTDALLMAALEYVDVPGYSALILRRDFARLNLGGAIMARSREWLTGTDAKWSGTDKKWTFPSGATLQFGYIDNPNDRFRYASAEYQFIGWDELTEFRLGDDESNPYTFMFSRLRKKKSIPVPLRVRSASNPGGESHTWVKNRFVTEEAIESLQNGETGKVYYTDETQQCAFVPALLRDNPFVDFDEYMKSLSELAPVVRQRLVNGDWSVVENAIINSEWFRRYTMRGLILEPRRSDGTHFETGIDERECWRFAVLDSAGTEEDKEREKQGKPPSYSALGIWDYAANYHGEPALFLRHIWRARVGFTDLIDAIIENMEEWDTADLYIENAHFGKAIVDVLKRRRTRIRPQFVQPTMGLGRTGKPGKVERSTELQNMMEQGQYYLPTSNTGWLLPYEQELLSWTGRKDDTADQIDISSYAAMIAKKRRGHRATATWSGAQGFNLIR